MSDIIARAIANKNTASLLDSATRIADVSINVKDKKYGAIGDGSNHLVYPTYSTKQALQLKYPSITDAFLTSIGVDPTTTAWQSLQVDWCAITQALSDAKTASSSTGRYYPVYLPPGSYITSAPFQLYNGLTMTGALGVNGNEFDYRTTIKNGTTDIFWFNGSDITDICLTGLSFSSSTVTVGATRCFQQQDLSTGYILRYSKIYNCAFKYFSYVIDGRLLGTHIYENNFNNGTHIFNIGGADSTIRDNFMAVQPNNDASFFMVTLNNMSLSRFDRNFFTGRNSMCMNITGCSNMEFNNNWWDYTNQSGIYIVNSSKLYFNANYYGRNVTAPAGQYTSCCVLYDSNNIIFDGDVFYNEASNVSQYALRRSTGNVDRITIRTPRLDSGFILKIATQSSEWDYLTNIDIDAPFSQYKQGTLRYPFYTTGASYFDTQLGKPIYLKTPSIREVDYLVLTGAATSSGNITVTLNGVATNVAVSSGDSTSTIATKISQVSFPGWTVGVFGSQVTFYKTASGVCSTPTVNFGTTGTTGTITVTTAGSTMIWADNNGQKVWGQQQTFAVNDKVVTDNNVYQCTVAGTTGTVMPTHTSGTATDGTVTWSFVKSII